MPRNNEPRIIQAKYYSRCRETGREIFIGETCVYYPVTKTIYGWHSKRGQEAVQAIQDRYDLVNERYSDCCDYHERSEFVGPQFG